MIRLNKKKPRILLFLLSGCLLLGGLLSGCSRDDYIGMDRAEQETAEPEDIDSVAAENKTYGLSLPNAKKFGDILQDFIYWEYATSIDKYKNYEFTGSIINDLKRAGFPETKTKIRLYYRECDKEEKDYSEGNFYEIVAFSPENKRLSDFSFEYNARGLCSEYEDSLGTLVDKYGNEIVDKDGCEVSKEDISPQEIEKHIAKDYTFFGETEITIKKSEAKNYEVKDKFPAGKKEQILSAIRKTIKKQYKEDTDTAIYIQDFLPGDYHLSGREIDLDITDRYEIPLFWIYSSICYSGAKMEKFEGIDWYTHYSTAYDADDSTTKTEQVKKWAKAENDAVDINNCILAFRIKNGKVIDITPSLDNGNKK